MKLTSLVRSAIEEGPIGHVVTLSPDGSPHVSLAWLGLDGDEVVIGTMYDQAKLRNMRRDPRVTISFETGERSPNSGLNVYVVLHGRAVVTERGAPELLQRLAYTYIGPRGGLPPFPDPPSGWVTHVTVERITGSDPVPPGG